LTQLGKSFLMASSTRAPVLRVSAPQPWLVSRSPGFASCLSLLSNAVVLWNTLQIERIVTELRARGTTIRDEDLVHVWPLQRRHITPKGVYFANRTMPAFVLPDPVEA
jgi:hypothetical protein